MKQQIIFRKKDHDLFLAFWKKFSLKLDVIKDVVMENTDESIILSYESQSHSSGFTKKIIRLWLADAIVMYYKEEYLKEHLVITRKPVHVTENLLIKALTVFDKSTDTEMVIKKLGNISTLNVYSFYVFCLGELRVRWQEICNLFSKSIPKLVGSEVFVELMRYLLVGSESGVPEAWVNLTDKVVKITDKSGKDLTGPIGIEDENFVSRVMLELISLAPEKIYIGFQKTVQPELICAINNLFESKVVYCT